MEKRKIKWNALASFLLALLLCAGMAGCSDDEEDDRIIVETFNGTDGMEGERITQELKYVPAYVRYADLTGYVSVFYSQYADVYWLKDESNPNIVKFTTWYELYSGGTDEEWDVINHRIGIPLKDFEQYDIPFDSKVYISASVTNIGRILDDGHDDWLFDRDRYKYIQWKAYLKDIRIRE